MSNTFTFTNAGILISSSQRVADGNRPAETQLRFGLS